MTNFDLITVADMALAMTDETPYEAIDRLCTAALHTQKHPFLDQLRWDATGLPVRHGLLMAWLAAEMRS